MDFWTAAQTFGISVACLFFLSVGVAAALRWAAKVLVEPLVARHLKFLDELSLAIQGIAAGMQAIAHRLAEREQRMDEREAEHDDIENRRLEELRSKEQRR